MGAVQSAWVHDGTHKASCLLHGSAFRPAHSWLPAGEWTKQTAELLETGTVSMKRPGTVERQNGRVAMTVLHAHHHLQEEEVDVTPSTADPARGDPSKWAGQTVGVAVPLYLCSGLQCTLRSSRAIATFCCVRQCS